MPTKSKNASYTAVHAVENGDQVEPEIHTLQEEQLPPYDVMIEVHFSSLNYKDALSATGSPGITKQYPHTPGIDAAGYVLESRDPRYAAGEAVIVTGYDLGMNTWGGFGQYIRVPGDWIVPLPSDLTLRQAMMYGTAGLTAAMCIGSLACHVQPEDGDVLVTGATGGVGSYAVALLSHLGYRVTASTGTPDAYEWLRNLGATEVIPRQELSEENSKALAKAVWAGAVDTVGGTTLSNIVKSVLPCGAVACCGVVSGPTLDLTVFPFILRGVSLHGADSQNMPMGRRLKIWEALAGSWKLPSEVLEALNQEIFIEDVPKAIHTILQGRTKGHLFITMKHCRPG